MMVIGWNMIKFQVKKVVSFFSAAVGIFWKMGTFVCCDIPKRTFKLYITAQNAIIYFPFHCALKLYTFIRKFLPWSSESAKIPALASSEPAPPQVLTFLTNGDTSPKAVVSEMRNLTMTSLEAIQNVEYCRNQLLTYKKKLYKWRIESDKSNEEMFKIGNEEKRMIKVIAAALKHLKHLKNKREKLNGALSEAAQKLLINGIPTANEVLENKLSDEDFRIRYVESIAHPAYKNILAKPKDNQPSSVSLVLDCPDNITSEGSNVVELLHQSVEAIKVENISLKQRLAVTNDKLDLVMEYSNNLVDELVKLGDQFNKIYAMSKEMSDVQSQLDQAKNLLFSVEADRDGMKAKLLTLEGMIKEEEEYMGFESSFESGFEDNLPSVCSDFSDYKLPIS